MIKLLSLFLLLFIIILSVTILFNVSSLKLSSQFLFCPLVRIIHRDSKGEQQYLSAVNFPSVQMNSFIPE